MLVSGRNPWCKICQVKTVLATLVSIRPKLISHKPAPQWLLNLIKHTNTYHNVIFSLLLSSMILKPKFSGRKSLMKLISLFSCSFLSSSCNLCSTEVMTCSKFESLHRNNNSLSNQIRYGQIKKRNKNFTAIWKQGQITLGYQKT